LEADPNPGDSFLGGRLAHHRKAWFQDAASLLYLKFGEESIDFALKLDNLPDHYLIDAVEARHFSLFGLQ
jgi:hypothetical protein